MDKAERFPYLDVTGPDGYGLPRPLLPLKLQNGKSFISLLGLLDTGATVSVLSYEAGIQLGFIWEEQTRSIEMAGNLGQHEAHGVIAVGHIGEFPPTLLTLAWTRAPNVPLLLGQVNFFGEFDVCFFQTQKIFEISPKMDTR